MTSNPNLSGELWSFLRKVLSQGKDIHLDHQFKSYELYSARLDAAARERADELMKLLGIHHRDEVMNPPASAAEGAEARNLNMAQCHGTGAVPQGQRARPTRSVAAPWNKCDECGRYVSYTALETGIAIHRILEPDSDLGVEKWETLCPLHYSPESEVGEHD